MGVLWRAIHIITLCLSHGAVHPGERILEYLHAKGEGLTIVYPKVIKGVYVLGASVASEVISSVDSGFNVIFLGCVRRMFQSSNHW